MKISIEEIKESLVNSSYTSLLDKVFIIQSKNKKQLVKRIKKVSKRIKERLDRQYELPD